MMRTKQVAGMLLAAGLMGSAGLAQAGGYLGGGIGSASYDYDDVDNSTAIKLYGGYTAPLAPNSFFGVEAAYVDLGEADITSLPGNWSLQMEGFSVAGLFQYVLPDGGLGFFGKIGAYSLETTLDTPYGSDSEDSAGLLWGLGLTYSLPSGLGFRGEIESYEGVDDYADDNAVTVLSAAVQYNF